jgi:hypothetical protein
MKIVKLTKEDLLTIVETAMDIDRYTQMVDYDVNVNYDVNDTLNEMIDKLHELSSMLKNGKRIDSQIKQKIYHQFDEVSEIYNQIKFGD